MSARYAAPALFTPVETIVRFNDTAHDWATLQRLVGALERNAIRSLHPRPLEVGYGPGFDNWIIA